MTRAVEQAAAATILRVLVDGRLPPGGEAADAALLLRIAAPNEALLRVASALRGAGVALGTELDARVAREESRVASAFDAARAIAAICARVQLPFLFPKVLQHHPDLGDDLDLLVLAEPDVFADRVLRVLAPVGDHHSLASRIAGSAGYHLAGCETPLDVQHGRLGRMGEHRDFPQVLHAGRRSMSADDETFEVPSAEDHLVLQGMQRVYGRTRITLADVAYAIRSIRHDALDWRRVLETARAHGVASGLACYLTYVEDIHREVFGAPLLPARAQSALRMQGWGRAEFRRGYYRYPTVRVATTLYALEFGAHLRARRWDGAGRLCLLPALGVAAVLKRLAGAVAPTPVADAA